READRQGSRSAVVDEIVRLGEAYSIVTEYTSFLVLENDAEYRRWKIDRRNLERLGRDRAQQRQVQAQLEALRERALAKVGPSEPVSADLPQPLASRQPGQNPPAVDAQSAPVRPSSSPRNRD